MVKVFLHLGRKAFREGLNPPGEKTQMRAIAFVKSNPGAVGYVSKAKLMMKVVHKF